MTGQIDAFTNYRQAGVSRFVQSAVVIDNEAEMRAQPLPAKPTSSAVRSSGSILGGLTAERVTPTVEVAEEFEEELEAGDDFYHSLNAKQLTDAWSEREVICGLYRPEPSEDMVDRAIKAASRADIVILDWFLVGSSSVKAKEIIVELIKGDLADRGRLRLLSIYTSQPGITTIANEILDAVEAEAELKGFLQVRGTVLEGRNIRICILNKPQTVGNSDVDKVSEPDLPSRLLTEFIHLTNGLLSSFSLHSIAAVRRAAHHIVTVFKEGLDGAYIGHRCAIGEPDDARELAVDMVLTQLRNVIAVDEMVDGCMDEAVLNAWVDQKSGDGFSVSANLHAPVAIVKKLVLKGKKAIAETKGTLVDDKGAVVAKSTILPENVGALFYPSAEAAWDNHLEFARISSFKREAFGLTQLPRGFKPTLTLGSVIKILGPKNDAEVAAYAGLVSEYYVCMQPRCDSVRLDGMTGFPFQTAEASTSVFNMVVKERGLSTGTPLLVSGKLSQVSIFKFAPDSKTLLVQGVERNGDYIFTDDHGREFVWLGDVRDLKAQQDASALAASVHRVGLDEHEWLRLAINKNTKISFRPPAPVPAAAPAADPELGTVPMVAVAVEVAMVLAVEASPEDENEVHKN